MRQCKKNYIKHTLTSGEWREGYIFGNKEAEEVMFRLWWGKERNFPSEWDGDEPGRSEHAQAPDTGATSLWLQWCDHTLICVCVCVWGGKGGGDVCESRFPIFRVKEEWNLFVYV